VAGSASAHAAASAARRSPFMAVSPFEPGTLGPGAYLLGKVASSSDWVKDATAIEICRPRESAGLSGESFARSRQKLTASGRLRHGR
jgi:hypothetical protein